MSVEHNIQLGERHEVMIDGHLAVVGLNQVLGEWLAAYLPQTPHRFEPGDPLTLGEHRFEVVESVMSSLVPKMASLRLKEVG